MTNTENNLLPFNEVQGIASTNVPAYSNECDSFISFEGYYVYGIFTGFQWQCVEFARRWLLLRKSCIFLNVECAYHMWENLSYIERVTDGKKFPLKMCLNGSPYKPKCDSFLIYPCSEETPFGHVAVICEVHDNFIRVTEQNYRFHYWSSDYARQIPLIHKNGLYYIEDYYNIYGWLEIENNDQLKPLDQSNIHQILLKYKKSRPAGNVELCFNLDTNLDIDNQNENLSMKVKDNQRCYYKADEDFHINISNTSNELYRLSIVVADYVICHDEMLTLFGIPNQFWSRIRKSWKDEHDCRTMDYLNFKFDRKKLKLSHFNRCSMLHMLPSAIEQEELARAMHLEYNFTSSFQLRRLLVCYWKTLNIKGTIHILLDDCQMDSEIIMYMQTIITEAGISTKLCRLHTDIYWKDLCIVDKDQDIVENLWTLWNWDSIFQDFPNEFYKNEDKMEWNSKSDKHPSLSDIILNEQIRIIDPLWKSITCRSGFLSILNTVFHRHSNILQKDSKGISDANSLMKEFIDETNISCDKNANLIMDHNKKYDCDYCNTSEQILLKNIDENSDEIVVSWMTRGLCSGFSICKPRNDCTEINKTMMTYCCII